MSVPTEKRMKISYLQAKCPRWVKGDWLHLFPLMSSFYTLEC